SLGGPEFVTRLLMLAREHVGDREPMSGEGEALLNLLTRRCQFRQQEDLIVRPGELGVPLAEMLKWRDPVTGARVAASLRRLAFSKGKRPRDGDGVRYLATEAKRAGARARSLDVPPTDGARVAPGPAAETY